MPLPFFLAAIFGKAVAGSIAKGVAAKAATKIAVGHHSHHALAKRVAEKVVETGIHLGMVKRGKKDDQGDNRRSPGRTPRSGDPGMSTRRL